jgi:starch synthase (maltosyl-transferring)
MKPIDGRRRVLIEGVSPQIDAGGHPVRRICGDILQVSAAVFADGKDEIAARVLYRHGTEKRWQFAPMRPEGNDLWSAEFPR